MDLIPKNVPKLIADVTEGSIREYRRLGPMEAIARITRIEDGKEVWRHREEGVDCDYPVHYFKTLREFEAWVTGVMK